MKDQEIYQIYHTKYSAYTAALIDLSKETFGEEVLKKYEEDHKQKAYDEEEIEYAREILYDYLKKCIEYYDEIDEYLIRVNRSGRKVRKKIYKREYIGNSKTPEEIIKSQLE